MTQLTSLYLHVPFCKHLCNYCDFYKKLYEKDSNQIESFHQFLEKSWVRHEKLLSDQAYAWSPLESLYLGGGTPSLWGIQGANFMNSWLQNHFSLASHCEFTMEVDPGTWTQESLEAWKKIGLNRISIGTQTLDPNFIKIMDRSHSLNESHDLLNYCQKNDWNFSLDFLLGLPYSKEKKRDIKKELQTLLSYHPKHVSLYILNARSKYPHVTALPDDEFIREEYLLMSEYLRSEGFLHYEVSNFALPGYESKHNLKYWKMGPVAALGPTGTGFFPMDSDQALRYKWKVSGADFEEEKLGPNEIQLEKMYLSLRTNLGWTPTKESAELKKLLTEWNDKKYTLTTEGKVILSPLGYLMLDSLMDDLFRIGY
jgi:oxygen-independent coproporphyrinogen-3 oxidase